LTFVNFFSFGSLMMKILLCQINNYLLLFALLFLMVCDNSKHKSEKKKITYFKKVDTTKPFKVDTFWVTPKKLLKFNSLINESTDTLDVVICADYVYSPFGVIKDKSKLPNSLLKNFSVINKLDTTANVATEVQKLYLGSSKLILFFDNDPEASRHSYIIKGEIYDSEVNFIDKIKIGMSKLDFFNTFFDDFPAELQKKYNIIAFESCVDDIRHIYSFKENKLNSVKFNCVECAWKIDY